MELGKLFVTIAADTKALTAGLVGAKAEITKTATAMSGQFRAMGLGMVAAGAIITAAFGLTIKGAMNFEAELAQVSTMLDDTTMKYMPEYKKGLESIAVEFGESTKTLSKGLYSILSASIDPAKALDVLAISAEAAVAGITDTGTAAYAIVTVLNSYGLEAEEAGKVSDQLFAIVKRGQTTFAELAPAIGTVAATAHMAGLSFEDLGASIATVTRAGISTNEAMTAINGVLKAFLKPQTDAITLAWDKFKLTLDTTTLKTIGLTGVMEKLKNATAEELAIIFGSIRGLKAMAAALGDVEGYGIDFALMLNSAGLRQEALDKQTAALKFQLGRLKESFVILFTTIGEKFLPVIKAAVAVLIGITGAMKKFMDAHPLLTKAIVLLTAVLGILVGTGGMIMLGILAFQKMVTTLLALKTAFIAIKGAVLLLSGPFGWVIGAVTALYLAWTTNFLGIRDFTLRIVEKIKEALGWLWDKITWVLEKIGLYKKEIESGGGGAGAFADEVANIGTSADTTAGNIDDMTDSIGELGDGLEATGDKLDEFGNKIETFDEWVARLAEENKKVNDDMAAAAEEAYKKYTDAMQPVEDRLYELSHTEEEVAAKNLLIKRQSLEEIIKAAELSAEKEKAELTKIKEWYDSEIQLIIQKLEEQEHALIEVANKTEESADIQKIAVQGIISEYDLLIHKIVAVGKAIEDAAKKAAAEKWLEEHPITPEEIAATKARAEEYKKEAGFAEGTSYVKKTGWAKIHEGEAIFPKRVNPFVKGTPSNVWNNQKSSNTNTYSPIVNVTVQGDGDAWGIKRAIKEALNESAIQFGRRGSWLMPSG